MPLIWRNKIE
jgi:parallel beta-helix repeat protein